jgi:hypothetical protein
MTFPLLHVMQRTGCSTAPCEVSQILFDMLSSETRK